MAIQDKMNSAGQNMRITDAEMSLIKNTFAGNEDLLKLLRKIFLPEYDAKAPLGQVVDLWMTLDVSQKTPEEAYALILARNQLIKHVEQQLIQLRFLAGKKDETVEETKKRLAQNSTQ